MYLQNPIFNKININRAILVSIIIHAMLLINLQWAPVELLSKPVIEINLQKNEIKREQLKQSPPIIKKPRPIEKLKPIEKPMPIKEVTPIKEIPLPLPTPVIKPIQEQTSSEGLIEQKPTNLNPQVINDYTAKLRAHIESFKRYPRMAQIRGWEGQVLIQAEINQNGLLVKSSVVRSSGRSILDKEALAIMQRSIPFPLPPKDLNINFLTITIPISFSLI